MEKIEETSNIKVKNKIEAWEARIVSSHPTKLLNIIFRNINEEAELGATTYICRFHTSHESAEYIAESLKICGYDVSYYEDNEEEIVIRETDNNNGVSVFHHIVSFVISWSKKTPN